MKKILAVDNHPVTLKLMTKLLEKEGYQVLTAEDGISALEILKTHTPDIIFTDLVMPNIDGKKLCQIIREMPGFEDIYIVILSAVAAEELSNCADFGANACIAKGPFNSMARNLLSVLEQLQEGKTEDLARKVMGIENVFPRTITRELLSAKKHFEIILGSMREGILELTPDAKIVYANPAAVSLLGKSETEFLSSDFTAFFQEDDQQRINEILAAADHMPQVISEDSPVTINGKQVAMTILPIRENDKRSIILIINDITLRKKMEARLQQARKMEALGNLAGGIAHDFNNLLMGILGNVSLLLLEKDTAGERAKRIKNIEQYVRSGSSLTRQLLDFARGENYEVKPTDLNDIIQKSSEMFGRTKKEIKIHRKYQPDIWTVEVDKGQIERVLLNLYVNAWQAMPAGGKMYLKTENIMIDKHDAMAYHMLPGKYVKISVLDTGVGMDERSRQRIFEPFFTTKKMNRGTGLGLASAYGIIRNHGGVINVSSKKGKGTVFNIYLPVSGKKAAKEKVPPERILRGTETVLLVDDEEMIIQVEKEIIEALGYRALIARGGKEAIEVYRKNPRNIDMVILDMTMPDMGGSETYRKLKMIDPEVKVLLSSGYSINGQAKKILGYGCNGFIQKPFTLEELSRKAREVLGNRRGGIKIPPRECCVGEVG